MTGMTLRYDMSNWIDGGVKLYSEMGKTRENEFEDEAYLGEIKSLLWVMLNLKYLSGILVDMSRRKLGIRNSREVCAGDTHLGSSFISVVGV